jgi:hypothetical protein
MSPLFYLGSDFIDRMTNPRYGARENEEYALKFAELLKDEVAGRLLREEAEKISDVNTLPLYGWIWLLNWARSAEIKLNANLLSGLMEQWQSPVVMALIIDVATQPGQDGRSRRVPDIDQLGNEWLRTLLEKCVVVPENEESFAQNVLIALLQSGTDVSLDGAAALLQHRWTGGRRILEFFYQRLALVDEDTQAVWIQNLDPPRLEDLG